MKQTDDTLLREALRRRAERLLQTLPPPSLLGRERSEKQPRKTVSLWPKIVSIGVAAAIVVGVFLGRQGHEEVATPIQPPMAEDVSPSPIPPRGDSVYTPAPTMTMAQTYDRKVQETEVITPLPREGNGGGVASLASHPREERGGESAPAPSLSELYASINEMTDAALQEADRLTVEAMTCGLSDDRPS